MYAYLMIPFIGYSRTDNESVQTNQKVAAWGRKWSR